MRALWSDRPNCSHNVAQKVKRIKRFSDEILEPQENTPQNTGKIPKMRILGILGVFLRYFRGILGVNSGSPEFRAGGIFSVFFVDILGRAIAGLCSRSGRSQHSPKSWELSCHLPRPKPPKLSKVSGEEFIDTEYDRAKVPP